MIAYDIFHLIHTLKRQGLYITQISEISQLSENTVRKYLRQEKYQPQKRCKRPSKLLPFTSVIDEMLRRYSGYTAQQVFQEIKTQGYPGGYSLVKEYLRKVRPKAREAYLTLHFKPGESAQVDWGVAGYILIDGQKRKVSFFVMIMSHSRAIFVYFTLSEAQEFWLECHQRSFEYFGGISTEVMVDNCKTAVISHRDKDVVYNKHYIDFANHYGFKIVACRVRQPQEKGRVERAVGFVRSNFINGRKLEPFEALNQDVRSWLDEIANVRKHQQTGKIPAQELLLEQEHLQPLSMPPYECVSCHSLKVNKLFRVRHLTNLYSVPPEFVGENVILKASVTHICIYHDGKMIARHLRSFRKKDNIEEPAHAIALVKTRKTAKDSKMLALFLKLDPICEEFFKRLDNKRPDAMTHVCKILALRAIYGDDTLRQALLDAHEMNAYGSEYISNILMARNNVEEEMSPLHISHKKDLLDLEIPAPDFSIYDHLGE